MSLSYHKIPTTKAEKLYWQNLHDASVALPLASAATKQPMLVITADIKAAKKLERELHFFSPSSEKIPILNFPDWETLAYDHFSPHQDIISQRLQTLYQLPMLQQGVILIAAPTLMQQLPPRDYLELKSFILKTNEVIDLSKLRLRLENAGYHCVNKVLEHGEFAVRGSIIDLFPMGSRLPFRIDLMDQTVDSIRTFDPDSQRSINKIASINLLPAKEYPLDQDAIFNFRQKFRSTFPSDPNNCPIYQSVSLAESYPGIEYYLALFFPNLSNFFAYLPHNTIIVMLNDLETTFKISWQEIKTRYEQLRHDQAHPLLDPKAIYLTVDQVFHEINTFPQIQVNPEKANANIACCNFNTSVLPNLEIDNNAKNPLEKLQKLLETPNTRFLFIAESAGRQENLLALLQPAQIIPTQFNSWQEFVTAKDSLGIAIAPLDEGLFLLPENTSPSIIVITEHQLYGERVMQRRLRKAPTTNIEASIRNLTELQIGEPVVHLDYGVGRYLGLETITTNAIATEFVILEYANAAKLYVPVSSLHLLSRYSGVDIEHAPLYHLGSKQWEKAKREAQAKIRDVAAELLEVYARRQANKGFAFVKPDQDYYRFTDTFPFEETPDQERAINEVIEDMTSERHMDRLICGDVGFGKTEVAMRAAFLAVHNNKQVAILTPTTLLAQQHYTTFQDRFANYPIKVELLSRFRSSKDQQRILQELQQGKIDIVIGTHKLIQPQIKFKDLGLLIVDEEHRFGVKQKEHIKKIRPNIDILTLTATPIPRTLNMAFANIRDFSIIATPPAKRLSIKTFVHERDNYLIKEAIMRELMRGGQVYFLHNDIATIEKTSRELEKLIPTARIGIAHGQMREHELELIMRDFYHQRNNVLVCTTIIESGIDVPTANTIIIDRADKFGLAQLHQLRGRVGRSHHQAYAYLFIPSPKLITKDAQKRLEAISSMEDLGSGFILATHDLEIRGAGELLGEEQSGEMQAIGFNLYMELLERAVTTLKAGGTLDLETTLQKELEIDLQISALIPETYLDDVNMRLVLYKRIASAKSDAELSELQVEMIDRFGLLPEATKNLFKLSTLKLAAETLGIEKISFGANKGTIIFSAKPNINALKLIKLAQTEPQIYKIKKANQLDITVTLQDANAKFEFLQRLLGRIR